MAEVQTSVRQLKDLYPHLCETVGEELRKLSEILETEGGLRHNYGKTLGKRVERLGEHVMRGDRRNAEVSALSTARGLSANLTDYNKETRAGLDRIRAIFCNYAALCADQDVLTLEEPSPSI